MKLFPVVKEVIFIIEIKQEFLETAGIILKILLRKFTSI